MSMVRIKSKIYFLETIIEKILETNLPCEITQYWKSYVSIFNSFMLVFTKFSFWQEEWALSYHSLKFTDFLDTS